VTSSCLLAFAIPETDVCSNIRKNARWFDRRLGVDENAFPGEDVLVQRQSRRAQNAQQVREVQRWVAGL